VGIGEGDHLCWKRQNRPMCMKEIDKGVQSNERKHQGKGLTTPSGKTNIVEQVSVSYSGRGNTTKKVEKLRGFGKIIQRRFINTERVFQGKGKKRKKRRLRCHGGKDISEFE